MGEVKGLQTVRDLPELDESSRFDWAINVRNISQTEVGQLLVLFLAQPADETLTRKLGSQSVCCEAVLCEAEVEKTHNGYGGCAELFLLFDKVGAADEANGTLMAECREKLQHFRSDGLIDLLGCSSRS